MNWVAIRLPSVIVPVLSSSMVSTSPAASTARPLIGITLTRIRRSIPAIPIADSRPPIVVGIRQTSNATITVTENRRPEYRPSGTSVTQAIRKMIVMPESRTWSAISLGVFCRFAPSTRPIIRSRNDSPGSVEIRTTIRSERTLVPPVTAERSPPLSRITGADSPVTADSSTDAIPSTTSPSPGMICPASTTTRSPLRSVEAGTGCSRPSTSFRAGVSFRSPRSAAAWALPRPSASASAKFANSTVNHSQSVTWPVNQAGSAPAGRSTTDWSQISVVRTLPISTTNITGFLIISRGSSFRKLSTIAARRTAGSHAETARTLLEDMASEHLSGLRSEVLDDRPQAEGREESQGADDHDDPHQQGREQRAPRGKRPGAGGSSLFPGQDPRDRERGDDHPEPADQHGQAEGGVVPGRIRVQAAERRAVVSGAAGEGVED